jgi:ribosome-associated protein
VEPSDVVAHLLRTAEWGASRSSGPGGQHRDKASTRAELTIRAESVEGLPPEVADALTRGLHLDERPLRLSVQDERSLSVNQEIAIERLQRLVADAMTPTPPRRPTRPTRASRERRIAEKVRRGLAKGRRQPPSEDD